MEGCKAYFEDISALCDGELNAEREREVREHIESCADCRALYMDFSAISGALKELLSNPPAKLMEGTQYLLDLEITQPKRWKKIVSSIVAVAACTVLLLILSKNGYISQNGGGFDNNARYELGIYENDLASDGTIQGKSSMPTAVPDSTELPEIEPRTASEPVTEDSSDSSKDISGFEESVRNSVPPALGEPQATPEPYNTKPENEEQSTGIIGYYASESTLIGGTDPAFIFVAYAETDEGTVCLQDLILTMFKDQIKEYNETGKIYATGEQLDDFIESGHIAVTNDNTLPNTDTNEGVILTETDIKP